MAYDTCSKIVHLLRFVSIYFILFDFPIDYLMNFIGNTHGSEFAREIQFQHGVLRECMKQLKTLESSRENLIFYLREALHEQVLLSLGIVVVLALIFLEFLSFTIC